MAMQYGLSHEQDALQDYVDLKRKASPVYSIRKCGLFVLPGDESWLGASPDAIAFDPNNDKGDQLGCVEVKCPLRCKDTSIVDVARKDKSFFLELTDNGLSMKEHTAYYYQVQVQLVCARLRWC